MTVFLRKSLRALVGVMDQATVWFVVGKMVSTITAPATMILVGLYLSQIEQGYFYTMYSVLNLVVFFELGLGGVLIYVIGNKAHQISWDESGALQGAAHSMSWLSSMLRKILAWYGVMACIFLLIVVPTGYYLLASHRGLSSSVYLGPFLVLVIAFAISVFLGGVAAVIEGTGRIYQVKRSQFFQAMAGSLALIFCLASRLQLWAVAADQLAAMVALAAWALLYSRTLWKLLHFPERDRELSWKREVLPLQWRVALSWLSGYFLNMAFVPILFAYQGPVEAGRMGMVLRLSSALYVITLGLVSAKAARLSALAASDRSAFLRMLRHSSFASAAVGCMGVIAFGFVMIFLRYYWPSFLGRLLPFWATLAVLAVSVLSAILSSLQIYARAQKQDPFVWGNLITAGAVTLMTWVTAKYFDASVMAYGYLGTVLVVGFPSQLIMLRYVRPITPTVTVGQ